MSEQTERLKQMVDEVFSGVTAVPQGSQKAPARRYAGGSRPRPTYQAVEDICWLYQDVNLAENLKRYSWREARRRTLRQKSSREWVSHRGRPPVRLTRKGVEVKLDEGVKLVEWTKMQDQVRARRS